MTQENFTTFGDISRRYQISAGLSQEELAQRASLSARAISDLERGVKRVSPRPLQLPSSAPIIRPCEQRPDD
jgi:transcriptional regulator with XRE-family HTH domain